MILKDFNYTELPIVFTPGNHRYKLEGIPMIGTTTIIGMKDKDFLKFWTVKEMYTYLKTNWDLKKVYTGAEKEELLMLGKKAWTVKKDKALDTGTIAHDMIEKSIHTGMRVNADVIAKLAPEVANAYQAFLDWEKTHEIEYLASELIMGSREHYVAGTVDAVAIIDGKLEVLDWKTSKQLSEDVFLQTASYRMMLHEGGITDHIGRRVVRFDKLGAGFEDYEIKNDYNKDIEAFLCLLKVYRWDRDVKKKYKDYQGKLKIN